MKFGLKAILVLSLAANGCVTTSQSDGTEETSLGLLGVGLLIAGAFIGGRDNDDCGCDDDDDGGIHISFGAEDDD